MEEKLMGKKQWVKKQKVNFKKSAFLRKAELCSNLLWFNHRNDDGLLFLIPDS